MKTLTATVVTATMAMSAGQTMAAAAAAAPAAPAAPAISPQNITQGPPITGLCVMSVSEVQTQSLYGKAINKQLDALYAAANAEVSKVKDGIAADANKLAANKATMTELQYNQQMLTLNDRAQSFTTLQQQRQNEMDATEDQQNKAFSEELQKIAVKVYQDQKCSLLIDRDAAVMIASPAMEISSAVTKAMDADKSTVAPFARVSLPAAPAATGGTK